MWRSLMLLTSLALLPQAASAPTTLPLRGTDGWAFYLPVQPGQTVRVTVDRGILSVRPDRVNPDYRTQVRGRVLSITLRSGALIATPRRGEGSTVCLSIRAPGDARYRLCPTAEQQSVGQSFRLKP